MSENNVFSNEDVLRLAKMVESLERKLDEMAGTEAKILKKLESLESRFNSSDDYEEEYVFEDDYDYDPDL